MAKRRAVSEVIAATLLIAVVATASFLAISGASKKTAETQHSVADALELKGRQVQELLSIISKKSAGDTITIELLNYGLKDIIITDVLVDGTGAPYTLVDSSGVNQDGKIIRNKILALQLQKGGQTVQIITDTKNILKITI
ncbi:hypothetical protein QVH35_07115 [Candidatus Nitrosotenuis chungbukensis]|uniref:hypothetical protein n=1 Tax=Candidatus Nitrosotenuis chungbukensis TaxID=1353246 RepID=UPI0005B2B91D|nr:hypothetical protein [Candidatus Nitrosotenuis chungbukensis]WKT57204.1 hypothetical protein QVH35_07115 [Candidatus Nitrosotenuis chungbukensis]